MKANWGSRRPQTAAVLSAPSWPSYVPPMPRPHHRPAPPGHKNKTAQYRGFDSEVRDLAKHVVGRIDDWRVAVVATRSNSVFESAA